MEMLAGIKHSVVGRFTVISNHVTIQDNEIYRDCVKVAEVVVNSSGSERVRFADCSGSDLFFHCEYYLVDREDAFYCCHHDRLEPIEMYSFTDDGSRFCEDTPHNVCPVCGNKYVYFDENEMCGVCYQEYVKNERTIEKIKAYHDSPSLRFYKQEGEITDWYIGSEIETEFGKCNERIDITYRYGDYDNIIYQTKDGSLNDTGIECVTHPMSLGYWKQFPFEDWFRDLVAVGTRSHKSGRCGLHIHLSRTLFNIDRRKNVVGLVVYLVHAFKRELMIFSRRRGNSYCTYPFSTYGIQKDVICTIIERIDSECMIWKDYLESLCNGQYYGGSDRHSAINICNNSTIEFRMFRGTLNPVTYRASVMLCIGLVDYAKQIYETKTQDISWNNFINFIKPEGNLLEYLRRRKLMPRSKRETNEEFNFGKVEKEI